MDVPTLGRMRRAFGAVPDLRRTRCYGHLPPATHGGDVNVRST